MLPVLKHIPGHGRATADSHVAAAGGRRPSGRNWRQPISRRSGRSPRCPMGMTAHVVFTAFDPVAPATTSVTMVSQVIRDSIGFGGLLMSDDMSMGALSGSLAERTRAAIAAGCDIVLHCNGQTRRDAGGRGRGAAAGRDGASGARERRSAPAASRATSISARPARRLPPCWPTAGRPAHGWRRHDPRRGRISKPIWRPTGRPSEPALVVDVEGFEGPLDLLLTLGAAAEGRPRQDLDPRRWPTSISPSSRRRASCGSSLPPTIW